MRRTISIAIELWLLFGCCAFIDRSLCHREYEFDEPMYENDDELENLDDYSKDEPEDTSPYQERIIGGEKAKPGEFPYIAHIIAGSDHCGGAILTDQFIVTAAHCLTVRENFELPAWSVYVDVGEHDIRKMDGEKTYRAERGRIEFANQSSGYGSVAKVCMMKDPPPKIGDLLTIAGWGVLDMWGTDTDVLNVLKVPYIDLENCRNYWGPLAKGYICAGHMDGTKEVCLGDSGGPLVRQSSDCTELIGLVSFGYRACVNKRFPAVYTDVSHYREWIMETVGALD